MKPNYNLAAYFCIKVGTIAETPVPLAEEYEFELYIDLISNLCTSLEHSIKLRYLRGQHKNENK